MVIAGIVIGIVAANCCFKSINEGLPDYVLWKSFGIIDILYRFIKIIGTFCLGYSAVIISWHWPSILLGGFLFLIAFLIKKLVRHLEYKDWL